MRSTLGALRPPLRAQQEDVVNAALVSDEALRQAQTILVYKGVGHELSVVSFTNAAFRMGKRVVFPRVHGESLTLHEVGDWGGLAPGAYGIPEPAEVAPLVGPMEVDVAVVPGLAFTEDGRRLGQGGGYYDRLLPQLGGISLGVCFDEQVVVDLPTETHDRPVDEVLSPSLIQAGLA